MIHSWAAHQDGRNARGSPADGVAVVIDGGTLDLDGLRAVYDRIARAKRFRTKPAPNVKAAVPTTTVTWGIILAQRSDPPLETLGEELDRLNKATPGRERPELLVVASTGVISYGVQVPTEGVAGDVLAPAEGALEAYTPPRRSRWLT